MLDAELRGQGTLGERRPQAEPGLRLRYQPRKNTLVSSEFSGRTPTIELRHRGRRRGPVQAAAALLGPRRAAARADPGPRRSRPGPLELRWLHDPEADQGFVGATLASNIVRYRSNGSFQAEPVIEVDNEELEGWPLPGGCGLITDVVVSMDDRFLYFTNWLHGDLRQYDVSDPKNPKRSWPAMARRAARQAERRGPRSERRTRRLIQLSLDGRRLCVPTRSTRAGTTSSIRGSARG